MRFASSSAPKPIPSLVRSRATTLLAMEVEVPLNRPDLDEACALQKRILGARIAERDEGSKKIKMLRALKLNAKPSDVFQLLACNV